jgi:hypothetical protein
MRELFWKLKLRLKEKSVADFYRFHPFFKLFEGSSKNQKTPIKRSNRRLLNKNFTIPPGSKLNHVEIQKSNKLLPR